MEKNNNVCTSLGSSFFEYLRNSTLLFVTYLITVSPRHGTKAELFYSFNRNDNEGCHGEIEDEDPEIDQSVDASDLNFDEI